MEKNDIVEYLKTESNIEWLKALNIFIKSHIDFLEIMNTLEVEDYKNE